MEHAKELLSVPLSALVASPYNVRRYTSGQIEELSRGARLPYGAYLPAAENCEHLLSRTRKRRSW